MLGVVEPGSYTRADDELLKDLEDEWDIPCDMPKISAGSHGKGWPKCLGESARWVAWRANCCPESPRYYLLCDKCKTTFQWWIAKQAALVCGWCGEPTGGPLTFTPLEGKS